MDFCKTALGVRDLLAVHEQRRYMRGGCLAFAIALKRELGLAIYGLIDTVDGVEEWHHAFGVDEALNIAIDARGVLPVDAEVISEGMMRRGAVSVRKAPIKEIQSHLQRSPTEKEIQEARTLVWKHLAHVYEDLVLAKNHTMKV